MISYFEDILKTISESIDSLKQKDFDKLLDHCEEKARNGGKIIATGLGKNVPICEKFVGTLNSFAISAAFLHTNTAIHGDLGIIRQEDIVIMLSKSGSTSESVALAGYLLERGVDTWGISFNGEGELSVLLKNNIIMKLDHEGDNWDIVPNNSTAVYLILLQGLAIQLADRLGVTIDDFQKNHPGGSIGEWFKLKKDI